MACKEGPWNVEYSLTLWESCTKADKGMPAGYNVICPRTDQRALLAAGTLDALTRTPIELNYGLLLSSYRYVSNHVTCYFPFGPTRLPAPPCLLRSQRSDHAAPVPLSLCRTLRVALLVLLSATRLRNRK
jgi:hypothetical protein